MRIVEIPSPDVGANRNVIESVTTNILEMLGLNQTQFDIVIDSPYSNISQPGSTVGQDREIDYGNRAYVYVEVDDRLDEDQADRALGYDINPPIFEDKRYGLKIAPSYAKYECTITITRREPSRTLLGGWVNEVRRRIYQGLDVFVTEYSNNYRIPNAALNLINSANQTINMNCPEDEKMTLTEYMKYGFAKGVTLATAHGVSPEFVMRDTVARVVGTFDVGNVTSEKANDTGSWNASIQYKFSYIRAEAVTLNYPCIFNQTMIDERWWVKDKVKGVSDERDALKDNIVQGQDGMLYQHLLRRMPIFIPGCDRKRPKYPDRIKNEIDLFIGYATFDEYDSDKPSFLLNFEDLDDSVELTPAFIKYLKTLYGRNKYGKSGLMRITVFENDVMLARDTVYVDPDLNVWVDIPIDRRAIYMFTISVIANTVLADDDTAQDLRPNPGFIDGIIDNFRPDLRPTYPDILRPTVPDTEHKDYPHDKDNLIPDPDYEIDTDDEGNPLIPWPVVDNVIDDMVIDPWSPDYVYDPEFGYYMINIHYSSIIAVRKE